MPNANAITVTQPSQNLALGNVLMGLEAALQRAAESNVEASGPGFTSIERHAMVVAEELKLVNGMDLAAILLRYKLIKQIENEALFSVHPSGVWASRDAMAMAQGISPSQLSLIMDLGGLVFPYIENVLNIRVAAIWEEIGKSNFQDIVPVIKGIVLGTTPNRTVQASVDRALDDVAATAAASGTEMTDEQVSQQAVRNLLDAGQHTNRELRQQIRPERTASIDATIVNVGGTQYFLAELSEEQMTLVQRRLNGYFDAVRVSLPTNHNARRTEAASTPILGRLLRNVEE